MELEEARTAARTVIEDPRLTFHQRRHYLAGVAEGLLPYPEVSDACAEALNKRVICDLYEGHAPYRPRYVLPDYHRALSQGSEFLELPPPEDLDDALTFLLILYANVPSITGYPVFLGNLDTMLEPFVEGIDDAGLEARMRRFWISLDRLLPDGFVHANLGPEDTRVGRAMLAADRKLHQTVPNLTLKVRTDTPDALIEEGIRTVFETGKPHFVNDEMMVGDLGPDYGVVSCYNSLKTGGGSHTLVRLNLKEVALRHEGPVDTFVTTTLLEYAELNADLMEARIRYLVEEASFFEHDFLATEGLIDLRRFSAMYGIYGLAECVNELLAASGHSGRYGHDPEADQLALDITRAIADFVAERPMPHCEGGGGHAFLHSQSGIDSDLEVSAGIRVPIGDEPPLFNHITTVAPHHELFAAGVSDIFHIDDTVRHNPEAMVDVIRGAFAQGMRDFTFNIDSNEFVRITGYMVRKSELAKHADSGERHGSTVFAAGSMENSHIADRVVKRVEIRERDARVHQ